MSKAITIAGLVVFVGTGVLTFLASNRNRAGAVDGAPAIAHVLRAGDGSCLIGAEHQHCYALALEVHADATPPFVVELDVNIEDRLASRVQPGSWIAVVRDRKDPSRIMINMDAFADPAPAPPVPSR